MARRRPIYRKQQERPTSHKGLLLCFLLAGAVVLVPIGGGFMSAAKVKLRDIALTSGFIDLDDCVITASQSLACTSGAVGTPVPVAMHQMREIEAQAAEDAKHRADAEAALRTLTVEVNRLKAQADQNRLAARADSYRPSFVTTVSQTGAAEPQVAELPIQLLPNPSAEPSPEAYEPADEEE